MEGEWRGAVATKATREEEEKRKMGREREEREAPLVVGKVE